MFANNLTHQALATKVLLDRVRNVGGPISEFVLDIWGFVTKTMQDLFQLEGPAVHDALERLTKAKT